mgnify:CR=1 FL=1
MFSHGPQELNYARNAIEEARVTFQAEMRIFTTMDVVLVMLNGLLIIGVVGGAIWLWVQGEASVGVVAASTALALRLNAMTGWIMWALTSFFRQLGAVKEATAAATTTRMSSGTKMPEEEESALASSTMIGASMIGAATLPAKAVEAATESAAASAIFFIVVSSRIRLLPCS